MSSVPETVIEATGATSRQLDYWARSKRLNVPSVGSGNLRDWNDDTIRQATLIVKLLGYGFTLDKAADVARAVPPDRANKLLRGITAAFARAALNPEIPEQP